MEKHSSSKGEGSPCASGPGFKSSEWLWTFGPVIPTAQQERWISIPRHDGNGLQRSAGYAEIWPQRACNPLQHVHPNPQCHDVRDHGGPTWSWIPTGVLTWMRVCFLMRCIKMECHSCTILWRRKICLSCRLFWKDDLINSNSSAPSKSKHAVHDNQNYVLQRAAKTKDNKAENHHRLYVQKEMSLSIYVLFSATPKINFTTFCSHTCRYSFFYLMTLFVVINYEF